MHLLGPPSLSAQSYPPPCYSIQPHQPKMHSIPWCGTISVRSRTFWRRYIYLPSSKLAAFVSPGIYKLVKEFEESQGVGWAEKRGIRYCMSYNHQSSIPSHNPQFLTQHSSSQLPYFLLTWPTSAGNLPLPLEPPGATTMHISSLAVCGSNLAFKLP